MGVETILNYIQVSDRLASSGQPEDRQFKAIAEAGYHAVINLAMPNSENAIPEEGNIVTALGMRYVHIPVPFEAPDSRHLRDFIQIMQAFPKDKVWVHCVLNYRVSAFLYQHYRLALGVPLSEAKKVMLPGWNPNETWQKFMTLSDIGLAKQS
ncbi:MAG: phosphatase [Sedimenticola sp.]|nr:MAG: phosphatase [Sedimenticola sp.]